MYKAGIVGCGRIASDFDDDPKRKTSIATHAGAYKFLPDVELTAASDLDRDRLNKFGDKWDVTSLYTNYKEMLSKEKLDILSICTWSSTHLEICKEAVNAGVKAVFCEKPITESLAQADEMIELCARKKVILAVNHSRRWDKLHQDIKETIGSGGIGEIQQVDCYYTSGIANTGTHLLDLLRMFFGDASWVMSLSEAGEAETDPTVNAYIRFQKGFGAMMHALDVNKYLMFETDIYGTEGRLRIKNSGFNAVSWKVIDHPKFSGYKCLSSEKQFAGEGLKNTMVGSVQDIIRCLNNGGKPRSTGEDGRSALELIAAIRESLKKGGEKISLPLKDRTLAVKSK